MAETTGSDLLKTAFALVAERGWRGFSFTELARRAGVSLARVYAELPSRVSLVPRSVGGSTGRCWRAIRPSSTA